jgi:hypothetical protein
LYVSTGLAYPKKGVRAFNNEYYQKEVKDFQAESAKIKSKILKDVEYTHLQQEGGGEGGSEDCFGVFSLNGIIYKAEYSYFSYNGHDYEDILSTLKVVEAKEKTITVYN